MNELDGRLNTQTGYGTGLWRLARRECSAKALARSVAQLRRAHRALAQRDATLPRTVSAGRERRGSVELLQSHTRALEQQVLKVSAAAHELEVAGARRLVALEDLRRAAPTGSKLEWEGPVHPLLGLSMLSMAWCLWSQEGLGVSACCIVVMAALTRSSLWIEFDGRFLKIQRRLFGLRFESSSADLTLFNQVVVTDYEMTNDKGGPPTLLTQLSLQSGDREVHVGSGPRFGPAIELLTRQVRDWCAIAAKEAEWDS